MRMKSALLKICQVHTPVAFCKPKQRHIHQSNFSFEQEFQHIRSSPGDDAVLTVNAAPHHVTIVNDRYLAILGRRDTICKIDIPVAIKRANRNPTQCLSFKFWCFYTMTRRPTRQNEFSKSIRRQHSFIWQARLSQPCMSKQQWKAFIQLKNSTLVPINDTTWLNAPEPAEGKAMKLWKIFAGQKYPSKRKSSAVCHPTRRHVRIIRRMADETVEHNRSTLICMQTSHAIRNPQANVTLGK